MALTNACTRLLTLSDLFCHNASVNRTEITYQTAKDGSTLTTAQPWVAPSSQFSFYTWLA